jgi:hypothetical protein
MCRATGKILKVNLQSEKQTFECNWHISVRNSLRKTEFKSGNSTMNCAMKSTKNGQKLKHKITFKLLAGIGSS